MMRGLFGIVIAVAVVQIAAAAVKCPSENEADVTLIGNPDKCTTYYLCDRGHPFLMDCPVGLYFNPDLRICDWTIREEKNGCIIPPTSTTPKGPASSTTSQTSTTTTTTQSPASM
ncbi:peritrophin-1-like [Lasioglossum baleicum]|uniref:peritrophin-1-like n=1 Tax=Lasioglossum baleicum TaxID=434251 RepID=UPI003FCC78B8